MFGLVTIQPEELIIHKSLIQKYMCEYHDLVNSNQWKPPDNKKKYQDDPYMMKAYIVVIEELGNKAVKYSILKSATVEQTMTQM